MHRTVSALLIVMFAATGCASLPEDTAGRAVLQDQARAAIVEYKASDPAIDRFFDTSAGYAVFPKVTKGAYGVGGAHGLGVLYEDGDVVGQCELTQATIGWQLGGQYYSEVIFFQTPAEVDSFKAEQLEFAGQVSAVALTFGASKNANYENGVAVFTMAGGGLMYEASIGGQKFSYVPLP